MQVLNSRDELIDGYKKSLEELRDQLVAREMVGGARMKYSVRVYAWVNALPETRFIVILQNAKAGFVVFTALCSVCSAGPGKGVRAELTPEYPPPVTSSQRTGAGQL